MLAWVVINRQHPRQSRKSCPTCALSLPSFFCISTLSPLNFQLLTSSRSTFQPSNAQFACRMLLRDLPTLKRSPTPSPAIPIDQLAVAAKNLRLVLQEIHNLHRRALLVVVINLGGATRMHHALVNTLNGVLNVEKVHVHVAEGRSVVGERAVANGRSG